MRSLLALVAVLTLAGGPVIAQELRPLCPDRPGKGTSPCTVDAGHWQVEVDAMDLVHQSSGPLSSDSWALAAPTVKLGVSDRLDLEVGFTPLAILRVHDRSTGVRDTTTGVGDLYLRAKLNLVGQGGDGPGLAVEPFLKAPTASDGLGDGAWEGGLLVPVSAPLPGGWSLGLTPEADLLANASGSGRHVALLLPIGLGHAIGPVSGTLELWTAQDFDPSGTTRQYSLDLAAAWEPPGQPNLQLDGGVNLGLNDATPGVQVYVGLSRRF